MSFIERYNWFHVFIISLLGAGLIAAGAHFFLSGNFTASSSFLLSDRPDILANLVSADGGADQPSLERLQAILVSRELRGRIIDRLSLAEKMKVNRAEALDALNEMASVRNIGQDGISITVTTSGYFAPNLPQRGHPLSMEQARELSAEIANLYVVELDAYLTETGLAAAQQTHEFLRTRHDQLSDELTSIRDRLELLRAQYVLLDPDSEATRLSDRIRSLEQARADALAQADAVSSSLSTAESQLTEIDATRISSEVATRNPLINSLQEELVSLQSDLANQLASGKTSEHRDVVQIQSSIDSVREQLAELEEIVLNQIGEQPNPLHDDTAQRVVQLRIELAGARARRSETDALLSEARGRMAQMPAVAREYVEIERAEQLTAERLSAIERALWMAEYEETRTEIGAPFTILDRAIPPEDRDGPPTIIAGLIAFAVFVVLQGLLLIDRRWFGG